MSDMLHICRRVKLHNVKKKTKKLVQIPKIRTEITRSSDLFQQDYQGS